MKTTVLAVGLAAISAVAGGALGHNYAKDVALAERASLRSTIERLESEISGGVPQEAVPVVCEVEVTPEIIAAGMKIYFASENLTARQKAAAVAKKLPVWTGTK